MSESKIQSVVVTGGAGFIGSNFVRLALERSDAHSAARAASKGNDHGERV